MDCPQMIHLVYVPSGKSLCPPGVWAPRCKDPWSQSTLWVPLPQRWGVTSELLSACLFLPPTQSLASPQSPLSMTKTNLSACGKAPADLILLPLRPGPRPAPLAPAQGSQEFAWLLPATVSCSLRLGIVFSRYQPLLPSKAELDSPRQEGFLFRVSPPSPHSHRGLCSSSISYRSVQLAKTNLGKCLSS